MVIAAVCLLGTGALLYAQADRGSPQSDERGFTLDENFRCGPPRGGGFDRLTGCGGPGGYGDGYNNGNGGDGFNCH